MFSIKPCSFQNQHPEYLRFSSFFATQRLYCRWFCIFSDFIINFFENLIFRNKLGCISLKVHQFWVQNTSSAITLLFVCKYYFSKLFFMLDINLNEKVGWKERQSFLMLMKHSPTLSIKWDIKLKTWSFNPERRKRGRGTINYGKFKAHLFSY